MEGSPDCWANHWYNPPHSPRTLLIQSELKGWQKHRTQEQFLPSSNPSHEHLTITMVHTLFIHLYILYIWHTYLVYTSIAHNIPVHRKLSIVIPVHNCQFVYCYSLFTCLFFNSYFVLFVFFVLSVILLLCGSFCLKKQIPHICKHTWQ